ncbi:winged helix-turn-helix domain-containing protein [Sorangium sp. So ce1389]|uniref:winged helix-turn-helix domain-containing protein n=1 Tax=Sorangium sp. So ce1389 TaxID=3133336 RepID=UPI003F638802
MQFAEVVVDFRAHRVERRGAPVELTALEMKLLRFFVEREGALLPRQRILDAVWGADYFGTDRTVDNFINRRRAKLEPDPRSPRHLVTVRGAGLTPRSTRRGRRCATRPWSGAWWRLRAR